MLLWRSRRTGRRWARPSGRPMRWAAKGPATCARWTTAGRVTSSSTSVHALREVRHGVRGQDLRDVQEGVLAVVGPVVVAHPGRAEDDEGELFRGEVGNHAVVAGAMWVREDPPVHDGDALSVVPALGQPAETGVCGADLALV